jgi:hypothetical protein
VESSAGDGETKVVPRNVGKIDRRNQKRRRIMVKTFAAFVDER